MMIGFVYYWFVPSLKKVRIAFISISLSEAVRKASNGKPSTQVL